ncbi:class A beta-lactamase-related serine hydrolase [Microbacterium sp. LjRoot45]|uniref:Class A beta-lactamase-related serine hydrolase n=1 Tax=Candidatus Microbacterium phytovorans TaxID=3121374 RepID=A0AAJ5W1Y6_9MICO|nr:serine hydrolase [Microbacterium sp.]WEK12915.1 MAG: class A beta-lactamase-related serine hydrolase [Microbacterium sp.]
MNAAEPFESHAAALAAGGLRRDAASGAGARRSGGRTRRSGAGRRSFTATLRALDGLASSGAQVSVRVTDLDRDTEVFAGDDHLTLPVGGIGVVPLLIETASQLETGALDALEIVDRSTVDPVDVGGLWRHLKAPALPVCDLAVLAAATGDALATNALLARVGLDAVRERLERIGLVRTALMDGFRDRRGPDDAPHVALASAGELASLFGALVNARVVSPAVSAQVSEWLSLGHDLSLVASATGLDPFAHDDDRHQLLFVNKTGRADGVRAEAGVLAGPRAGVAYSLIVCFDDLSVAHRLRAHDAFRTLGVELMEYIH